MKHSIVVLAVVILAVACGDKKSHETPEAAARKPTSSPEPTVKKAEAAPAPAPAAVSIDCEKLLPAELQQKHGLTDLVSKPGMPNMTGASCEMMKDERPISVSLICPTWSESTYRETMENGREAAQKGSDFKDLAGVGRMAYLSSHGPKIVIGQVWDDDVDCHATLSAPDAALVEELARELVKNLTPAVLGK